MMIWSFLPDGTPILQKESELSPNVVHIDTADGMKVLLQRVDVATGQRMLGVCQEATLQMTAEFDQQLGKMLKFTCAITACPLKQHECYIGYRLVYIPSVTYGFATTSFAETQYDKLTATLNQRLLLRMGFNQSTPKAIIFATQKYSGLQLLHLQCEQVAAKINFVVKQLRADSNVGK
eukprot:19663-Ditylum_brightwellii.AAC.1